MRVTFISSGLETGGAEVALLRLLPAMSTFGIEFAVVSLRSLGPVGLKLASLSLPTFHLDMSTKTGLVTALPIMYRHLRTWRPALVHGWMYHGNLAAALTAAPGHLPVAWGIRQSLGVGSRDKWLTRRVIQVGALLSERAALIVYNSALARDQHQRRGYAAKHAVVIPNGFDTGTFGPDPSGSDELRRELGVKPGITLVGHVARFHPVKRHDVMLHAAARVREVRPDAVFVLVGQDVDASNRELTNLIGDLGLHENVRLLGHRSDVSRLMAAFDVLCLTSTAEGFPNVLGEAMSCGVPCVGTAVGDVADLIGDTGEVVPPGDPDAVASALVRLLSTGPDSRRALGMRARARIIERFSIGQIARRYADVLHAVGEGRH